LRITRSKPDVARDVRDEIELYIDERARELVEDGMTPEEADRVARESFGDLARIEADCRSISRKRERGRSRAELVGSLLMDVRYGLRSLARQPLFTVVACLTLAVCIGANASIFSIVNSILLQPLPYRNADRIVMLFNSYPNAGAPMADNSAIDYIERRESIEAFEEVALYTEQTRRIGEVGQLQQVFSVHITPSFFAVLGVEAAVGRTFTEDEAIPGNDEKIILSHSLWQQRYAGDKGIIGSQLFLEGTPYTIVGVMPKSFRHMGWDAQVWIPIALPDRNELEAARHSNGLKMLALLKPGATLAAAQSEIDALNASVAETLPPELREVIDSAGFHTEVHPYQSVLVAAVEPALFLLWGGVLFVLLIGMVNISNLSMVRSAGRMNELATRFVLGAKRQRIIRQLVTEAVILALIGGALGLLAASWSLRLLGSFEAWQIPRVNEVRIDSGAVLFTLAISLLVGIIAGVLPGLRIRLDDLYSVLRAGASTSGSGSRTLGMSSGLVALQVAIAFILLVGAGLMFTSLQNVLAVDPGFEPENVLGTTVVIAPDRYPDESSRRQFLADLLAELESMPGVVAAAGASQLPFSGWSDGSVITPEGSALTRGESVITHYRTRVSSSYFATMGIPLIAGRLFSDADRPDAPLAAIIDERMAELYWPGEDAVGKHFFSGVGGDEDELQYTVVGVVGEVYQNDLTDRMPTGGYYISTNQSDVVFTRLAIRTDIEARALVVPVRERILALDPEMLPFWTQTMDEAIAESLIARRLPMRLLVVFAAIALFLSAVGIYGVLAYSVGQRIREIGVRMALGCPPHQIYRVVLRQGMIAVVVGSACGLVGALLLSRLLVGLLYGVRPTDPVVLLLVAALIASVSLIACLIPVRRATRVNPVIALNAE
jgi:predicted permease